MVYLMLMAHCLPMRQEAESSELPTVLERQRGGSGVGQYHAFVQKEPELEMAVSGSH
jgi:hypothetical protein